MIANKARFERALLIGLWDQHTTPTLAAQKPSPPHALHFCGSRTGDTPLPLTQLERLRMGDSATRCSSVPRRGPTIRRRHI